MAIRRRSTRKGMKRKTVSARRAYMPARRRRRVSGMKAFDLEKIAGLMIGGIAGKYIAGLLPAGTGKQATNAAKVAAGLFLPQLVKGRATKFVSGFSDGLIVDGTVGLAEGIVPGVFAGIGDVMEIDTATLSGKELPIIANVNTNQHTQTELPIIAGLSALAGTL